MARAIHLLSARTVATTRKLGKHADGGGLYLLVRNRGNDFERLFIFKYKRGERGKEKERVISLGPSRDLHLATARDLARKCREALVSDCDPKEAISGDPQAAIPTFGEFADELVEVIVEGFKNTKHAAQWRTTLGDEYCGSIRPMKVSEIKNTHIADLLRPLWTETPATASRVRGRIERVLGAAKVKGYREGENPARWKENLDHLLPAKQTLVQGHHPALPWADLPKFMMRLRALDSISALALEWTILTVARTEETIETPRKGEVDKAKKLWVVPAERMKEGRIHRVPLCDRCIEIFDIMSEFTSEWLFPGQSMRRPLSEASMLRCLKRFHLDFTVHGFRSTFRDWVSEATSYPDWLAEAALSHVSGDKVERAYKRGDALERRRELMAAWEKYCLSAISTNVASLDAARALARRGQAQK